MRNAEDGDPDLIWPGGLFAGIPVPSGAHKGSSNEERDESASKASGCRGGASTRKRALVDTTNVCRCDGDVLPSPAGVALTQVGHLEDAQPEFPLGHRREAPLDLCYPRTKAFGEVDPPLVGDIERHLDSRRDRAHARIDRRVDVTRGERGEHRDGDEDVAHC